MRTHGQVLWDFVQEWLKKAEDDLRAADLLLDAQFDNYETAAFHAQQAAEKFIKAYLVRLQVEIPKTHEIGNLLEPRREGAYPFTTPEKLIIDFQGCIRVYQRPEVALGRGIP